MKTQTKPDHFAGFDWAKTHHDADGWKTCRETLAPFSPLRIAVEAGHADAAGRLAQMGHHVYMANPKSSKNYRVRMRPSEAKGDRGDCLALARALRFEHESWTRWSAPDALVQQLRSLCRDERALIAHRTSLVNQLIKALYDYYPAALQAFDDWTEPVPWAFVARFPTPEALAAAGRRKWQNFLHLHRCHNADLNRKRLEVFARAKDFQSFAAAISAKSTHALALVGLLQCLESQLKRYSV